MSIYAVNGKEPIAAWIESLDPEAVTSSKATDLVGTNHGTLTNMDLTADPDTARRPDTDAGGSRALVFDGSDDYVAISDPMFGTGNFSISAWFKTSGGGRQAIVNSYTTSGDVGIILDVLSGGKVRFAVAQHTGTNLILVDSAASYNDGQWHFVLAIRNGAASGQLYVDGTPLAVTGIGNTNVNTGAMRLGAVVSGYSGFMTGRIDDVRLWTTILNADDESYLRNGGNGRGRIVAATGKKRPRINGSLINSGLCRSSI